jgi:putative PIN family toxin of toxin-antitoxin system
LQRLKVVIDTNILVSAILNPKSSSAKIVSTILEGIIELCISPAIYEEYHHVLNYERFNFDSIKVERFLSTLKNGAQWFTPTKKVMKINKDDSDNRFLECAETAAANFLITGNRNHFNFDRFETTFILSPGEFWVFLQIYLNLE